MTSSDGLRVALEEVANRSCVELSHDGWSEQERTTLSRPLADANHVATFSRPLEDELAVVVAFAWARDSETGSAEVVCYSGLQIESARDLVEKLGGGEIVGAMLREPIVRVAIHEGGDTNAVVGKLVAFARERTNTSMCGGGTNEIINLLVQDRAVPMSKWTLAYAALTATDDMTDTDGDEVDPEEERAEMARAEFIAALYSVAGRNSDARRALTEYAPTRVEDVNAAAYRDFVARMELWLEGPRVEPPNLGASDRTPVMPTREQQIERMVRSVGESIGQFNAQREALAAVRAARAETPEEINALLENELRLRDVKVDAREVEALVDLLHAERQPFGRARIGGRAVSAFGKLVRKWRT
jgi:hypothetical protein